MSVSTATALARPVLWIRATDSEEEVRLEGPRFVVGRDPASDVVLPRETVSKVHALFVLIEGVYHVRDAGSTNGTKVNGKDASDWVRVRAGDEVAFGPSAPWVVVSCPASRSTAALDPTVRQSEAPPLVTVWSTTGEDGALRVQGPSGPVDLRPPATRFKLLFVLADAASRAGEPDDAWIEDDLLRARIWTRLGARDRSAQALNVLLSYTRRLLEDAGLPGTVLEKERGRTRLALPPDQVRVVDGEPPREG